MSSEKDYGLIKNAKVKTMDSLQTINDAKRTFINIVGLIFKINEENIDDLFYLITQNSFSEHSDNINKVNSEFKDILKKYHLENSDFKINYGGYYSENDSKISYMMKCIKYAILRRPKQRNILFSLYKKLYKHKNNKESVEKLDNLPDDEYLEVFLNDDVESFIKYASEPSFNPNDLCKTFFSFEPTKSISYLQLIALCGAVRCFKYAIMDGSFKTTDIGRYAIAGGNIEIINILEEKNISFDYCFEAAVMFFRNDICDWLLSNYKCEEITIEKTQEYFNDIASYFLIENDYKIIDINRLIGIAAGNDNSVFINYLIEGNYIHSSAANCSVQYSLVSKCSFDTLKMLIDCFYITIDTKVLESILVRGDLKIIKCFVENYGINFNKINFNGRRAIHIVNNNRIDLIKYLVEECNISAGEKDKSGKTVLLIAAENNNFELVKYLVEECKVNVNEYDNDTKTALYFASRKGDLKLIKYLVEDCHANIETVYKKALNKASLKGDIDLMKYLIEVCNLNINTISPSALIAACKKDDFTLVKYLVEECKASDKNIGPNGKTAICIASENGNLEMVKYLIEKGNANVETISSKALYNAIENDRYDLIKFLIKDCHANIDISFSNGCETSSKTNRNGWGKSSSTSSSGWGTSSSTSSSGWGTSSNTSSSGWGTSSNTSSSGWGTSSNTSSSGWGISSNTNSNGWGTSSK